MHALHCQRKDFSGERRCPQEGKTVAGVPAKAADYSYRPVEYVLYAWQQQRQQHKGSKKQRQLQAGQLHGGIGGGLNGMAVIVMLDSTGFCQSVQVDRVCACAASS